MPNVSNIYICRYFYILILLNNFSCNKNKFKYTCPRCSVAYCSLDCYKSKDHLKCSEAFYKQCIQDELAAKAADGASKEDMRKIYDILRRIRESDAGIEAEDFDQDSLDSDNNPNDDACEDDEADQQFVGNDTAEDDIDELDIADRLKDIDINDADEVWEHLTPAERDEFKKLVDSGEIMKLMPDYRPWWLKDKQISKIVELPESPDKTHDNTPAVLENIPVFSAICSKEPAPCIHYNLWNILGSYTCMSRYFNGEYLTTPNEAAAYLINLSATLKYGTNFEDVEDAIVSVEMEALTTGNGASELMPTGGPKSLLVKSREQLQTDVRQIMTLRRNKLAALSDILSILQLAKRILKKPNTQDTEFQKLFALSSGMEELTRPKIQQLCKKIQFYLSYVNRDAANDLK